MRIERLTPALAPAWDQFITEHPDGWFFHSGAWLEYQTYYREGNADLSFALVEERDVSMRTPGPCVGWVSTERRVIGVVPLMRSRGLDSAPEFSYSGDPLAAGLACDAEAAQVGAEHTLSLAREEWSVERV